MKITQLITYFFIISIIGLTSCNTDSDKKNKLNGRWEMKYAELNGQTAPLLEKMYFLFDGKNVTSNFNEATTDETTPFEIKESVIIKKSNPIMEFNIVSQTDTTLEMTTELRGYDYKLVLHRTTTQ